MQLANSITEPELKLESIELSKDNPGKYITLSSCFGIFLSIKPRLNIFDPSDSCVSWYALNGSVKQFSNKQKIADYNATPTNY